MFSVGVDKFHYARKTGQQKKKFASPKFVSIGRNLIAPRHK